MYDTCRKCIYKGDINACCKADCTAHNSWFSQQIIDALTELLDGQFEDDIRRTTGLPLKPLQRNLSDPHKLDEHERVIFHEKRDIRIQPKSLFS